jgi:RNA polymerase sigma-70 factor (ECF subfamily)
VERSNLVNYLDGLLRYALTLTRHYSDAEDLVQETYVRAFQKIDDVRNPDSIKPWMFAILRNAWISRQRHLRRIRIEPTIDLSSIPDTEGNSTNNALLCYERGLKSDLVHRALQQLPIEAREILILREFDNLSYREIAEILNCPVGTVMSRLARARLRLRSLLSTTQISVGDRQPNPALDGTL